MRYRLVCTTLALFLALSKAALASSLWYVDAVNGSDNNDCKSTQTACKTIGHAISLASSGDSIMVAAATYKEKLSIGFSVKIIGSGAKTTIIDGGSVNRVVKIFNSSAHVTLSKLTIYHGFAANHGGGISNGGTLTINRSTISSNIAQMGGSLGGSVRGGGIYNYGTLTINNSTLSDNIADNTSGYYYPNALGGGIFNYQGTLTINNSTLSTNIAYAHRPIYGTSGGGGIDNYGGTLTINNSTLTGNDARGGPQSSSGGISNSGTLTINNSTLTANSAYRAGGIGIYSGPATLQNTIVANNSATFGANCDGTLVSDGYNLSSDGSCNFNSTGDLNNTDPKLGTLGHYGGPTETIPLLHGSPAIDAGNPNGCTDGQGHLLKTDQRGKPRPDKKSGRCDMGAYERQKD